MKKTTIDNLFEDLNNTFDIEVPNLGHQNRFLDKLNNQDQTVVKNNVVKINYWKPLMAIAASIVICVSLFTITQLEPEIKDLASVSPELAETQDFFTATIAKELATLNSERSPETSVLIDDAMKQLNILETEYKSLKVDLTESGDDKRVIYAMISNFQTRIEILQNVLINIEDVKQFKQNKNEDTITI
ncbi:hypothetical protein A9Q87_11280 [Flavobacteriales bacterium 34_180_T64]|nr:hypothetical protein A9Q87_11280 [Flavobacteriales bacterium 34_180_T64]